MFSSLILLLVGAFAASALDVRIGSPTCPMDTVNNGVGLFVLQKASGYVYGCSGTMLSGRVFVTAAHCVRNLIEMDPDVLAVFVTYNPDPSVTADYIAVSSWEQHPDYAPPGILDVGVLVLGTEYTGATAATLPDENQFAPWSNKKLTPKGEVFTVVGYGHGDVEDIDQRCAYDAGEFSRLAALSLIVAVGNDGRAYMGDSGSPVFYTGVSPRVMGGTLVFGSRKTNTYNRADTPAVRDWLLQKIAEN